MNILLRWVNQGITSLKEVDSKEGLKLMGHKKNPDLKGIKKKEFPTKHEFFADIVGKCILCKDSTHDSVNEL